jgi:hypothetical protein
MVMLFHSLREIYLEVIFLLRMSAGEVTISEEYFPGHWGSAGWIHSTIPIARKWCFVGQAERTALAVQKERSPKTDNDLRCRAHRYPFSIDYWHHCPAFKGEAACGDGRMQGYRNFFEWNWNIVAM